MRTKITNEQETAQHSKQRVSTPNKRAREVKSKVKISRPLYVNSDKPWGMTSMTRVLQSGTCDCHVPQRIHKKKVKVQKKNKVRYKKPLKSENEENNGSWLKKKKEPSKTTHLHSSLVQDPD